MLFPDKAVEVSAEFSDPQPNRRTYVVGDLHGRFDLLEQMLALIDADAKAACDLVFLGDLVDRGEQVAETLQRVHQLCHEFPGIVHCLMGNHERMLLDFLEAPEKNGRRWLRFGGLQTLASYSVGGVSETSGPEKLTEAAAQLSDALPDGLEAWLRDLPLSWQSGNLVCVHAGVDPKLAISEQDSNTLIWGHPAFLNTPREDGHWIAYGHTVVEDANVKDGRIAADTGAYFTGRLSAAVVDVSMPVRFLIAQ